MTGPSITGPRAGTDASGGSTGASRTAAGARFTAQQQVALAKLSTTDRHVRSHEQAHLAAAGPYAIGGASYTYTVGPDGKLYAVGGDVTLDTSPDPSDPEKTIEKAKTIEAAANAPVDPSNQDRMVAAQAAQMEQAAEQQLAAEQQSGAYGQQDAVNTGQFIYQVL